MKLAMQGGDDESSSDEATVEVAAADATDTVADRLRVVGHGEAAGSQQLPPDSLMTPQKRTRTTEPKHPNKKCKVAAEPDKIKPRRKPPATSKLDKPDDRMLHCLFEGKTCIPLWPQYDMNSKAMYVKVASREEWLIQFAHLRRKMHRKGLDRKDVATMQSAKESNATFCKKILLEFRKVVKEAQDAHKKSYDSPFPPEIALTFNECDIFVRTSTRQMHIRADDTFLTWIRKGFEQALDAHFKSEFDAVAAHSQLIACGEDNVFNYTGQKLGVRDKIFWVGSKRTWVLSVRKNTEPVDQYLKENNMVLKVNSSAAGEDFAKQRQQALYDACVAWNELDKSSRYRIKLPEATEMCPTLTLPNKDDSEGSGAESSGEEDDADKDDENDEANSE